ncbi:MAG: putative Extracellular solute-binding protein family 5 [Candidatus Saccharibacteria bacterium]|nr:putative Extracellular solute-binding protein family 5 [Candidatus Saccharibacteria bacterium]
MEEGKPSRWQRLQKLSFNRKDLARRMRRAEGVTIRHARKFIFHRLDNVREVRRHIIMWVMAVGILIGASGLQLMWYQHNYQTTTSASDGTYAEAVLGPLNTLNPLFASNSAEESASQLLFSRLLSYDTTGHLSNDLASEVTVDGTGKTYTVTIRSDARWSDGIKVTAKDVIFTIGLLQNPVVHSTITGWNNVTAKMINDTTITLTLPAVYAAFEHALTFPILPEHILSGVAPNALRENAFSTNPVGSGPFKLRFIQDIDIAGGHRIIHMERNTNYYKGASKLERFQLHVYGTNDEILKALTSGEVNAASDLTATDVAQINQNRYVVRNSPIQSGVYALLNTTSSTLKDKAVRQALQVGTNTAAILKQLTPGTPGLDLPFTNGQLTGDVPKAPAYNAAAAAKILDDAGWKLDGSLRKKDGVALKLNIVTTKDNDYERVLETLAGQWRSLGITINTLVVDPADTSQGFVQNILQPRNFDVLLYQLTIGADPDVYAYWHSSQIGVQGLNFSNYANAISDDALASARSRLEPALRNNKYLTFAREWLSDVPAIGLYQSTTHYVYSTSVSPYKDTNVLVSPLDRYADVLYWSVGTNLVFKTP